MSGLAKLSLLALVILIQALLPVQAAQAASAAKPLGGCLDDVKARGEIKVGTSPDFPPFEQSGPTGELVGFDLDLVQAIGAELGIKVSILPLRFSELPDALAERRVDMIAAGMTISEERQKTLDFTIPYISGPNAIITRKETRDIKGLHDLGGLKVTVMQRSALEKMAKSVPGVEVKPVQSYSEATAMVLKKEAQAMMIHKAVAVALLERNPDLIIAAELDAPLGVGFAFRKDCPDLRARFDAAIEKLEKKGRIRELIAKWFR